MSQALAEGFYGRLTADQSSGTFYDDLGGRIYAMEAPEEAALPLMVFTVVTDPPDERFAGSDTLASVQLDLYGAKSLGIEVLGDIQAKALSTLQGAAVTIAGFVGGVFEFTERGARSVEDDAVRIRMEGLITATAT